MNQSAEPFLCPEKAKNQTDDHEGKAQFIIAYIYVADILSPASIDIHRKISYTVVAIC